MDFFHSPADHLRDIGPGTEMLEILIAGCCDKNIIQFHRHLEMRNPPRSHLLSDSCIIQPALSLFPFFCVYFKENKINIHFISSSINKKKNYYDYYLNNNNTYLSYIMRKHISYDDIELRLSPGFYIKNTYDKYDINIIFIYGALNYPSLLLNNKNKIHGQRKIFMKIIKLTFKSN